MVGIIVETTTHRDPVTASSNLWGDNKRAAEEEIEAESIAGGCSHKHFIIKGWYWKPEEAKAIAAFGNNGNAGTTPKYAIRIMTNAKAQRLPKSALLRVASCESELFAIIRLALPLMPTENQDYFNSKQWLNDDADDEDDADEDME